MFGHKNDTDKLTAKHKKDLKISENIMKTIKKKLEDIFSIIERHLIEGEKNFKILLKYINDLVISSSNLFRKGVTISGDMISFDTNNKNIRKFLSGVQSSINFLKNESHIFNLLAKDLKGDLETLKATVEESIAQFKEVYISLKESPVLEEEDKKLANEVHAFSNTLNDHLGLLLKRIYSIELILRDLFEVYENLEKSKAGKGSIIYFNRSLLIDLYKKSVELSKETQKLLNSLSSFNSKTFFKKEKRIMKDFKEYISHLNSILNLNEDKMKRFFGYSKSA